MSPARVLGFLFGGLLTLPFGNNWPNPFLDGSHEFFAMIFLRMRQPPRKLRALKIPSAKDCIAIIVFLVLPGGSLFRGYAAPSLQFEFIARWFKTNYNFTKLIASGDYIFAGT